MREFARVIGQKWLRVTVSVVISGAMMWLALRRVDVGELRNSLGSTSLRWLGMGLLFYAIELVLRTERWRRILLPVQPLKPRDVGTALIVGYAANNVLPARLGELFRADFLRRHQRISRAAVIGTIVVERLLDMGVVIACTIAGMMLSRSVSSFPSYLAWGITSAVAACLVAIVVLACLATTRFQAFGSRHFAWLARLVEAMVSGLRSVRRARLFATVITLSCAIWIVNGVSTWAVLNAVGVDAGVAIVLLVIGVSGIAAVIPSAPASLGTLQLAFVISLTVGGFAPSAGFTAASLIQVFFLGSATLVGAALYLLRNSQSASRVRDAAIQR